jgi:hypothetical protein
MHGSQPAGVIRISSTVRSNDLLPLVALLLAVLQGCQGCGQGPTLSVSPREAVAEVGGPPLEFTATKEHISDPVTWSFDPVVGTASPLTGSEVTYTPPASIATIEVAPPAAAATAGGAGVPLTANLSDGISPIPNTVTLTAAAGGASDAATITVEAPKLPRWRIWPPGMGSLSADTGLSATYLPPAHLCQAEYVLVFAQYGDVLASSSTILIEPIPIASSGQALVLVDQRLYDRLKDRIDRYLARAEVHTGLAIDLEAAPDYDDCSYQAVRDRLIDAALQNPDLEGVLFIGNIKLPSFFQSRNDNLEVRLLPRYYEDLDGVFRKDLRDGEKIPQCLDPKDTGHCYNGGEATVPQHDLDFTAKGPQPGPELWAAFMPVGAADDDAHYDDKDTLYKNYSDQLGPFLDNLVSYHDAGIASNGRLYYVSSDIGERMDLNDNSSCQNLDDLDFYCNS